jgi:hypothetical protein
MGDKNVAELWLAIWLLKAIGTLFLLWVAILLCKWGLRSVRLKREKRRFSKMTIVHPLGTLRPPQNFNAAEANIVDRSLGERKKSMG